MSYLIYCVNREDEALVRQEEVDVMFVNHPPDVVQPARHAFDRLVQELSPVRPLPDEGPLGIAVEFVEEAVDFALLCPEVEDGDGRMSAAHLGGAREDLSPPALGGLVKEGYELLLDDDVLHIQR